MLVFCNHNSTREYNNETEKQTNKKEVELHLKWLNDWEWRSSREKNQVISDGSCLVVNKLEWQFPEWGLLLPPKHASRVAGGKIRWRKDKKSVKWGSDSKQRVMCNF